MLCAGKFRMAEGRVQEEAGGGQQVNSSKALKTKLGNLDLPPQVKWEPWSMSRRGKAYLFSKCQQNWSRSPVLAEAGNPRKLSSIKSSLIHFLSSYFLSTSLSAGQYPKHSLHNHLMIWELFFCPQCSGLPLPESLSQEALISRGSTT